MSNYLHQTIDEDAALVASWRGGELASFEALVRKYQKRMLNIAYRITGDYEAACEVAQDAFVAAYREIDSLRGAARFSTWLASITVNLARARLRQVPAERRNGASAAPSPVERFTLHEKLQECIMALAAEFREVLVLRDLLDFSYDEICAILEVREGAMMSRLFRGREMVKECLRQAVGEP